VQVVTITGKPVLFHIVEVMGVLVRSETVTTTIFAVEPIMVPLPPKPAPKARAQQRGSIFRPAAPNALMTGIIAMAIGTLSSTPERMAVIQIRATPKTMVSNTPQAIHLCDITGIKSPLHESSQIARSKQH
jgi:hypothetical protein